MNQAAWGNRVRMGSSLRQALETDQSSAYFMRNAVTRRSYQKIFLNKLFEIGYLGNGSARLFLFKVKPWKDEEPDLVVAGAKRVPDLAWAQVEEKT